MVSRRSVAVAAFVTLTALISVADEGLAQGSPGYRMRTPTGSFLRPPVASVRPPRLTAIPDDRSNLGQGFGRRRVVPYQYFGFYPFGSYDYAYQDDSTADYSTETRSEPAREFHPVDDTVAVGRLQVSSEVRGSRTIVRLTWRDNGVDATQVAFFLADSARAVLAAETVRSPPFTWLFELQPRTRFAGMTVVLPGGSLVTQYVPIRRVRG